MTPLATAITAALVHSSGRRRHRRGSRTPAVRPAPARWALVAPSTDYLSPQAVDLRAGDTASLTIRLGVDETALTLRICDGCPAESPSAAPDATSRREAGHSDDVLMSAAEPLEGWDAFNTAQRPYPAALRAARLQGDVIVEGRIDSDGTTTDVHVLGQPRRELAEEAITLVRELTWKPADVRGNPVATPLHVTVEFVSVGF